MDNSLKKNAFLQRLREPDEDFPSYLHALAVIAPIGLGLFATCMFIASIAVHELAGTDSIVSTLFFSIYSFIMKILYALIIGVFLIFKIMQLYATAKLRKNHSQ